MEFVEQASPAVAACRKKRRRPFRKDIMPPSSLEMKKEVCGEKLSHFDH
jgi:hypothetical protein